MRGLWTEQRKYEIWLEIETLACEAMAEIGEHLRRRMRRRSAQRRSSTWRRSRRSRSGRITTSSRFLENVASYVGPAARWMHQGLTSSDVLDTTLAVQMAEASDLLLEGPERAARGDRAAGAGVQRRRR